MLLGYSAGARKVQGTFARVAVAEYENLLDSSEGADKRSALSAFPRRARRFALPVIGLGALGLLTMSAVLMWSSRIYGRLEGGTAKPVSYVPVAAAARSLPISAPAAPSPIIAPAPAIVQPVAGVAEGRNPKARMSEPVVLLPGSVSSSTPAARATRPMAARQLVVRYGDTLLQIAMRYLGSERAVDDLIKANPQLADVNRIYPGQRLTLPNQQTAADME
jgi:phage tail protein X